MIDTLISRLTKARKLGANRWNACCPAHEDRSPSLSIKLVEDGRILIHCFGGCSTDEVLGAVGMDINDLFPERLGNHFDKIRKPYEEKDVLLSIRYHLSVVSLGAMKMALNKPMSDEEHEWFAESAKKVDDATRYAHGI
jgi:DNA primase